MKMIKESRNWNITSTGWPSNIYSFISMILLFHEKAMSVRDKQSSLHSFMVLSIFFFLSIAV